MAKLSGTAPKIPFRFALRDSYDIHEISLPNFVQSFHFTTVLDLE